jgi:hypothetical protein
MTTDVRDNPRTPTWRRSSRCGPKANTNCVEVAGAEAGVLVRDSKGEVVLGVFDTVQWSAFLAHCRTEH